MSRENVEIVLGLVQAFNRGDLSAILAHLDEDAVGSLTDRNPEAGAYRGHEGAAAALESWMTSWDEYRATPGEVLDGEDSVFVALHEVARGRGSKIEVEQETFVVCHLTSGKVARWQFFFDRAEALAAAGLDD